MVLQQRASKCRYILSRQFPQESFDIGIQFPKLENIQPLHHTIDLAKKDSYVAN